MSTFWIREVALAALTAEAHRCSTLETGGVLVGYRGGNGDVLVTDVVGPGPDAIHRETAFTPDHAFHEREVARLYGESGRTEVYLGDWHTHPLAGAYLSCRDKRTLRRIARARQARVPKPFMVVMGMSPLVLKAWQYVPAPLPFVFLVEEWPIQPC
jgi:integrative and conjugative element protein (TIGR02256 family)